MMRKAKLISINFTVFFVAWSLLEIMLFTKLQYLPFVYHHYLPKHFQILAQSSKGGTIPENYIMIAGDSYAEGAGDWAFSQRPPANGPFYSGHIISRELNQDVITVADGGVGNIQGFFTHPIEILNHLESIWMGKTSAPQKILLYFYEGNDLHDNLREAADFLGDHYSEVSKTSQLQSLIEENKEPFRKITQFPLLSMIRNVMTLHPETDFPSFESQNSINQAEVNKQVINLPDRLQSPALELTDQELQLGLRILNASVLAAKKEFPQSQVFLVYLPSPLTAYNLKSDHVRIQTFLPNRSDTHPSHLVLERHFMIKQSIKEIAKSAGVTFVDTSESLIKAAQTNLIHGPLDWFHLNEIGQRAIAKTIAERLQSETTPH